MPGRYSFVQNVPIPPPLWEAQHACLPIPVIPIAVGALESRAHKKFFAEGDDDLGMQLIRRTQVALIKGCQDIEQLYRLIDSTFNGVVYTNTGTPQEPILMPPIPLVPTVSDDTYIKRVIAMENRRSINSFGVAYGETVPVGESLRELLKQIRDAAAGEGWTDEEKLQLFAKLAELLLALA